MIDTKTVTVRRQLKFGSLDQVIAEAERIADADRREMLQRLGNWTPGQAFGHLAAWMSYPYDGYPMPPAPWPIRIAAKLMLRSILRKSFSPGYRLPKSPDGTYGTELLPTEEGLGRLRRAAERMKNEPPRVPSPVFGTMTHQQAIALNLRHAELHLSFFQPA